MRAEKVGTHGRQNASEASGVAAKIYAVPRFALGKITAAKLTPIAMGQSEVGKHRLNIQRAQSAVLIDIDDTEYAIVADDNYNFKDNYWQSMVIGLGESKPVNVSGKLGNVQDPIGKQDGQTFLGATTPIVGGALDHLSLSPDGNKLLADVWVDEPTAGGSHAYRALFVWDAHALITAALEAEARGQKLSTPIDRVAGKKGQIAAATPVRYNGAEKDTYFGWIYDIGTFKENITVAQQGNYGDVIGVDLAELVAMKTLGLTPGGTWIDAQYEGYADLIEKLTEFNIGVGTIESLKKRADDTLPPMQIVLDKEDPKKIYSRINTYSKIESDFSDTGVLFLAPTIDKDDQEKLRKGETIGTKPAVAISFSYKEDGVYKEGIVNVSAKDYDKDSDAKFFGDRPLDNPGYSAFKLKGAVVAGSDENDPLDVWRVEQRLKYLGFPAMHTGTGNTLQPFTVDGKFKAEEAAALKLFEKVVRYENGGADSRFNYQNNATVAADRKLPHQSALC